MAKKHLPTPEEPELDDPLGANAPEPLAEEIEFGPDDEEPLAEEIELDAPVTEIADDDEVEPDGPITDIVEPEDVKLGAPAAETTDDDEPLAEEIELDEPIVELGAPAAETTDDDEPLAEEIELDEPIVEPEDVKPDPPAVEATEAADDEAPLAEEIEPPEPDDTDKRQPRLLRRRRHPKITAEPVEPIVEPEDVKPDTPAAEPTEESEPLAEEPEPLAEEPEPVEPIVDTVEFVASQPPKVVPPGEDEGIDESLLVVEPTSAPEDELDTEVETAESNPRPTAGKGPAPGPSPQSRRRPARGDDMDEDDFFAAVESVPSLSRFLVPPTEEEDIRLEAELEEEDEIPLLPTFPESLRPRSATGWSTAEGPVVGTSGEEIDWSPRGELLVAAIDEALSTPSCTEIHGYGPNKFSARVNGHNALLRELRFENNEEYMDFIQMMVEEAGGDLAWKEIRQAGKGVLQMRDGSRLAVILQPRSPWPLFSIRKHTVKNWDAQEFVDNGTLSQSMLIFLQAAVMAKTNILIVGEAGSGKTSLLRALAQSIGNDERIAVLEQVEELFLTKPLAMPMTYRDISVEGEGLVDMLDILLYKGIDRLLVGEVHFNGLLRLLETMMLTPGSLSTYHARSAAEAGERMLTTLQVETGQLNPGAGVRLLRKTLDLIVVLAVIGDRHRCVQIMEVDWRHSSAGEQLTGSDLFVFDHEKERFLGKNMPDERGPLMSKARERKVNINNAWFQNPEDFDRLTRAHRR